MPKPINSAVSELLFHVARRSETHPVAAWVKLEGIQLDQSQHAEELGLIERRGDALDWPYVRLSELGKVAVEEAIAAMRAVR